MLTLAYKDVGRNKKAWTTTVILSLRKQDGSMNEDAVLALEDRMLSEVRKSGALMSRDIDVCINEDLASATIFAGVRPVGTVTITSNQADGTDVRDQDRQREMRQANGE